MSEAASPPFEPEFLTLADALLIHNEMIRRYGGNPGMHDIGLLKSALAQPQAQFGGRYLHADLYEMATAYAFHIVKNHPFVDGNKRTGLGAAVIFLRINGLSCDSGFQEFEPVMWRLSEEGMSKPVFAAIIRRHWR